MLKVDVNTIKGNDSKYAHAMVLTLNHFNFINCSMTLFKDNNEYVVYSYGAYKCFNDIHSAIVFLIKFFSQYQNNFDEMNIYYNNILKLDFTNNDAIEYFDFYNGIKSENNRLR